MIRMPQRDHSPTSGAGRRHVMILTWNPDKWHWDEDEYLDLVERTAEGETTAGNWSTGSRVGGVFDGDRVFLLRQGIHGRGIVASGSVASEIYQAEDWDESGGSANYVDVLWEHLVPVEDALPTEVLKQQLPETKWDRLQMSGTFLKPELIDGLEQLWCDHLASLTQERGDLSGGQVTAPGVVEDLNPRLNAEITENDVLLFDTGLRLSAHIAELAEARTLLSMAEHCRMYGSGPSWDQADVDNLANAIEKFTEVTESLDGLRDLLRQLMQDVGSRSDLA
jgi:hypothetical protein